MRQEPPTVPDGLPGRGTAVGTDQEKMMEDQSNCTSTEKHQGHICVLRGLGLTDEIARLTANPTHVCFTCGTEVNNPANVCVPMPLKD